MTTLISKTEARPNNASYGWHEGAFYFIPSPTDLDIGYMSEETYKTGHALRFPHFDIPPGQVIKNAYITYFGWSTYEGDFCNSKIYGEKALNPVSFSTWADFQARPKTDISVTWDAIPHWYPNVPFHSPNIAAVIQEIITQPGWAQGNPIVLFCDDLEGRSSAVHRAARHAWAYYEHFEWQPFLTVEYGPETNFAVTDISYFHLTNAIIIRHITTNLCHLTCYYTDKKPGRHKTSRTERGLTLRWGAYFCFVAWKAVEQIEPGDTLVHTFQIPDWEFCQTKWLVFRGTVSGKPSPSISPIFKHHFRYTTHSEEQLLNNASTGLYGGRIRAGQRLTIPGRKLTNLSFLLYQYLPGATGPVTFEVWADIPTITLVASKLWGDASLLPAVPIWKEVEFDAPVFVNGRAIICIHYPGPGYVGTRYQNTDVKPYEFYVQQVSPTFAWSSILTLDMAYKYRYLS